MHAKSDPTACIPKSEHPARLHARRKLDLEHPADCIYLNDGDQRHFGIGLYRLEDADSQLRTGGISVYDLESVLEPTPQAGSSLKPKMHIDAGSGVVNFEWDPASQACRNPESTHITCLCSDKSLKLFRVCPDFSGYELLSSVRSDTIDDNNQIIGLDLSCVHLNGTRKTCYSISDGRVFVVRDSELVESEFQAHPGAEVWTVSFLDQEGNLLATGGDDCALSLWDLRTSRPDGGPAIKNSRSHSMGVTCIQKSNLNGLFWTGSYDETLRLWDSRAMNSPVYEHKARGGIWRIDQFENYLGMAQCYFGLEYLKLDPNLGVENRLASLPNDPQNPLSHNSIVYGIDTFRANNLLFGLSCSFYDKTAFILQIPETQPAPAQ